MKEYLRIGEGSATEIIRVNDVPVEGSNPTLKVGDKITVRVSVNGGFWSDGSEWISEFVVVGLPKEKSRFRGNDLTTIICAMRKRSIPGYPEDIESLRNRRFCGDLEHTYCCVFKRLKEIQEIMDIANDKLYEYKDMEGRLLAVQQHKETAKNIFQAIESVCDLICTVPSE